MFVLKTIPADPKPTEADLRAHSHQGQFPTLAKLLWREAVQEKDPDAFLIAYVPIDMDYQGYLESALWHRIRRKVIKANGGECCCCSDKATEAYHRDYRPRVLAGNDLTTLVPLCKRCHHLIEDARIESWNGSEDLLAKLVGEKNAAEAIAA